MALGLSPRICSNLCDIWLPHQLRKPKGCHMRLSLLEDDPDPSQPKLEANSSSQQGAQTQGIPTHSTAFYADIESRCNRSFGNGPRWPKFFYGASKSSNKKRCHCEAALRRGLSRGHQWLEADQLSQLQHLLSA